MRIRTRTLCIAAWLAAAIAFAAGHIAYGQVGLNFDVPTIDPLYDSDPYSYHASTAGEGFARGLADIVRSRGERNVLNSEAAINFTEAQRRVIENFQEWAKVYFEVRRLNREYRRSMRGPRPKPEDYIRYAQMGLPRPLSPGQLDTVTGEIDWPVLLEARPFDYHRTSLQELFVQRAERGGWAASAYLQVLNTINAALGELQYSVRQLPPSDYMTARRFLESLAFEARRLPE